MPSTTSSRRRAHRLLGSVGSLLAVVALLSITSTARAAPAAAKHGTAAKPTVVLVHGAWADSSGWGGVIARLQRAGYPVIAPANPLRGLASDSAYLASVVASISGPVVLVGHSYGGAVITDAAAAGSNVKALVYIAGFALDQNESVLQMASRFPGSSLPTAISPVPFPLADGTTGTDVYIAPAKFRDVFAADVPATQAAVLAATQRPVAQTALLEPSTAPAWATIPSWYLVAKQDHAIPPAAERFMAKRAHARTVEIASSHAAMVSHPAEVTQLIVKAATAAK
jgi:pimeloyl-ACP methyl ester carboxylesterase